MIIDICSFLPVAESYRARLSGWASIPGYLKMFAKGLSAFCGVPEAEFRRRAVGTTREEIHGFIDEISARLGRPLDEFISLLDAAGYDKAVVFSIDQESTTGVTPLDPDVLARAVDSYPERILAFQGVDPNKDDAAAALEEGVRDLGLHGAFLVPFLHRLSADAPAYRPIYQKCVELDVPAWIHTSVNWAPAHPMELGRPLALDRLCGEMPDLKVIAGHGGWPWVPEMVAAAWRHPNLYIDPSGHRWKYFTTPGSGWEMLLHFGNSTIQDKILFGTDWPLLPISLGEILEEARNLPLKPAVMDKWLGGNAAHLLGLGE